MMTFSLAFSSSVSSLCRRDASYGLSTTRVPGRSFSANAILSNQVGLLPKGNSEQVPFAYSLYKNDSAKGVELAHGFKHAFSRKVEVRFLGVW